MACFDPAADNWSLLRPLPNGHGEPGVAVLNNNIYILGGRSHDKGDRMKYVHVFNTDTDKWDYGTQFKERVSGVAACVALMPPAVMAQAKGWDQCSKASWEDLDINISEELSDD